MTSFMTGPVALYINPPIEPQFYAPNLFVITGIAVGQTTTVTLSPPPGISPLPLPVNLVVGQLVRFVIPQPYGIRELNEQSGYVIQIISTTQVVVDIDSSNYSTFTPSTSPAYPQLLAVGDINTGHINLGFKSYGLNIPGSFINISPQ